MRACTMANGGVMFIPDTVECAAPDQPKAVINYRTLYQAQSSGEISKNVKKRLFGRKVADGQENKAA